MIFIWQSPHDSPMNDTDWQKIKTLSVTSDRGNVNECVELKMGTYKNYISLRFLSLKTYISKRIKSVLDGYDISFIGYKKFVLW